MVPFQGRTVSFKGGVVLVSQIRGKILSATRRCRQHAMQVEAMRLEIEAMQDSQPFLGFGEGTLKKNLDPKVIQPP